MMHWLTMGALALGLVVSGLILLWCWFVYALNWAADQESQEEQELG